MSSLKSFKIRSGKKILDYQKSESIDLKKVEFFFRKDYSVEKIWTGSRHVFGILSKKGQKFFLKLAKSEGISVVTQNEKDWNTFFNKIYPRSLFFAVPKNYGSGFFQKKYFYLITDYIKGDLLCPLTDLGKSDKLTEYIDEVLHFTEVIQQMPIQKSDYKRNFLTKTKNWFFDIPSEVRKRFEIQNLMEIFEDGLNDMGCKVRHGDFTPWHIIKITEGKLVLLDGEHARLDGIEDYDICYFIQRVFAVLRNPPVAQKFYNALLIKDYKKNKLKTVLAARAIGGFLDESLTKIPNYQYAANFKDWVINI